jgi:arylsulfatase
MSLFLAWPLVLHSLVTHQSIGATPSDAYGHLLQKVSWQLAPMSELMSNHLKTLADYPPVQGSKSFEMSNAVQDFIAKSQQ